MTVKLSCIDIIVRLLDRDERSEVGEKYIYVVEDVRRQVLKTPWFLLPLQTPINDHARPSKAPKRFPRSHSVITITCQLLNVQHQARVAILRMRNQLILTVDGPECALRDWAAESPLRAVMHAHVTAKIVGAAEALSADGAVLTSTPLSTRTRGVGRHSGGGVSSLRGGDDNLRLSGGMFLASRAVAHSCCSVACSYCCIEVVIHGGWCHGLEVE